MGRDLAVRLLTLSFGFGADEALEEEPSDKIRLDLSVRPVSDRHDLPDFEPPNLELFVVALESASESTLTNVFVIPFFALEFEILGCNQG